MIVGNYPIGIGGDFIVAIDGKPVEEGANSLSSVMGRKRGGDWMDLTIYRTAARNTSR